MPGWSSSSAAQPMADGLPPVDILIPHFNDARGLALSLDSIDAQDWTGPRRIVVADDGSEPSEKAALEALLEQREGTVAYLPSDRNQGRPHTRNRLLDAIESPYTAWLDAGDAWYPSKLRIQMEAAEAFGGLSGPVPYWITCNFDWKWEGRPTEQRFQNTDQDQVMGLLRGTDLRAYLWTVLGPSSSFKSVGWFDEALPRLQDLDFFIRFVLKGGFLQMPSTADSLCIYNKSDIGRNAAEIRACHGRIFDKHRVLYTRYGAKFAKVQLYRMEINAARFAANNRDNAARRRYLVRAFRHRPKQFIRRMLKRELP